MRPLVLLLVSLAAFADPHPLLNVRRVYVDKLTGTEAAAQMRDLLISALEASKLFTITENEERADAFLRGAAEDHIFVDTFQSSDSIDGRASIGTGSTSKSTGARRPSISVSVGENESTRIAERKHEAFATVRLVERNGDVIWSTTQESGGAKFRGASADVADKIAKQLAADIDKARRPKPESK